MKFSELGDQFLKHLAAYRGYSPHTIAQYGTSYDQFRGFLLLRGLPDDLRHFTDANLEAFATWLPGQGVGGNTVRHRLTALSSLAVWLMRQRDPRGRPLLADNPTRRFEWPTYLRPATRYLHRDELAALLTLSVPLHEGVARTLLVETGLRVSELIRADVGDLVEQAAGWSLAVTVKGRGRRREIVHTPLSPETMGLLRDWLEHRARTAQDAPLLTGPHGQRWTRSGLTECIRRMAERAGIDRLPVRPHVLRHTANVIARAAGLDPFVRSRLLHHQSPVSLQRYEHLAPDELHEARARTRAGLARYVGPAMPRPYATPPDPPPATLRNADDRAYDDP